ncbi:MAG: tetratricopeptide repeat protein [Ignavibacteriaceae bacterium]
MKKIYSLIFLIVIFIVPIKAQTTADKYTEAMNAYNSRQYALANRLFQKFFIEHRLTGELYSTAKYYSSDALMKLGEKDAAAAGFEYLVNYFKWSNFRDKALYKLGIIYFETGQYADSRERLKKLLDEYPSSNYAGLAYYWIGEDYSKENNLEDAIVFLRDAINNNPYNKYIDYSIYTLATIYEKIGDYDSAIKYYDNLLSYHSNSPLANAAHIRIGICYFKVKDYDSSTLELNNPVLKSLPPDEYSEDLYLLANSYYRIQDYTKAEKAFIEIIENYPGYKDLRNVRYDLAWCYFQQKHYENAYKVFNSISDGEDSIAIKSFYWKAESKRYAGQEMEAFNLYREFVNRFPNSNLLNGVMFQIGGLYFNTKKYDLAEKYLMNSASDADSSIKSKSLMLLGEIELEKKNFETATNYFQSAMKVPGASASLINRSILGLGASEFFLHRYEDAITNLSDISFRDPNFEKNKVNFYLAESFYALGKYRDALSKYDKVNYDNPEVGSLSLYGKAYCFFNLKEFENAAKTFSEYIKKYPESSQILDARLRLADSYYGSKNFDASSKIYKEMFRRDRGAFDNPYAYYQYAQALYKANKTSDAINEFKDLQGKFPGSEYADKSLYVIGWIYFQQGNYARAIDSYRNVLSRYPNSPLGAEIYYSIGDSYYNLADYDSAIINYQKVMTDYPSSPHVFDAINGIQYCYVAENHPEKAISLIDSFVDANPGMSSADQIYFKKGDIYYSIQDYKNAEVSYKEFIANYPKSKLVPQAYYWVGKSAENLDQNQDALFYFERVFDSYPGSESAPAAVIEMGNIYNGMKNYDAALELYDKALTTLPNSLRFPEILFMKGMTLSNKNDVSSAAQVFNTIIQEYGQNIFADKSKLELGIIDMVAKDYTDATLYLKDLAQSRTDEIGAEAQYYLGEILFEQNNIQDAVSAFVTVGTVFPAYEQWVAKSNLRLGDCYVKLKDFRKAKEIYRAVFIKHRSDIFGNEARLKLRKLG